MAGRSGWPALLALAAAFGLAWGSQSISVWDALRPGGAWDSTASVILWQVRLPRVVLAALVGAVLHNDELMIPKGETRIQPGDKVVVFSMPQALDEVEKLFQS